MKKKITHQSLMKEIFNQDYALLQIMSRFGIPLGFGNSTVEEVCQQNKVDCNTFVAVCNFMLHDQMFEGATSELHVESMLVFLRKSHGWFLNFMLPSIRQKLITAIDCSKQNKVAFLILQLFDDYALQVNTHMEQENDMLFHYVDNLLTGKTDPHFRLNDYKDKTTAPSHLEMDGKMKELKDLIVRYCPTPNNKDLLTDVLYDIFIFDEDHKTHHAIEEQLFIPAVKLLEEKVRTQSLQSSSPQKEEKPELLSNREKDIIRCVVKGLTNKETAEQLYISVNTVLTHRRNIAQKLEIHSPAGLVIYAIVNGIVDMNEIQLNP